MSLMLIHLQDLLSDGLPAAIGAPRIDPAHNLIRPFVGLGLSRHGNISHVGADFHRSNQVRGVNHSGNDGSVNNSVHLYGRLKFSYGK